MGGGQNDRGKAICTDSFGNIYSTGIYLDTVDFDPGSGVANLTSKGGYDVFIQKLDASGNLTWVKSIGGMSGDEGNSIDVDNSGNVYVSGSFEGTVDFDPGINTYNLSSSGSYGAYVLKLDSLGNFCWAKSFGTASSAIVYSMKLDDFGNIYTTGYFVGTVDFDPDFSVYNVTSSGYMDSYIMKLDTSGNFHWANSIGGDFNDVGNSIYDDASGNIYITGNFKGTVDFDSGASTVNLSSNGQSDVFVQKIDSSGNLLWVKTFGGSLSDSGESIYVDSFNNVYVTGYFQDIVDFDSGVGTMNESSNGQLDAFIQKIDSLGNLLWVKTMGGIEDDYGLSICTDEMGNVYTYGAYKNIVDFDPGMGELNLSSSGELDVFIQKLDAFGNLIWVKSIGGGLNDFPEEIDVDNSGNFYVTGSFQNTVDFNPETGIYNITSNGSGDIFIQKYSQLTGVLENVMFNNEKSSIIFPNPAINILHVKDANIESLSIIDLNGRIVLTQDNPRATDISILGCGVYFVQLNYINGEFVINQFIKQ